MLKKNKKNHILVAVIPYTVLVLPQYYTCYSTLALLYADDLVVIAETEDDSIYVPLKSSLKHYLQTNFGMFVKTDFDSFLHISSFACHQEVVRPKTILRVFIL